MPKYAAVNPSFFEAITKMIQESVLGCVKSPGVRSVANGSIFENIGPVADTELRELSRSPGPILESFSVWGRRLDL